MEFKHIPIMLNEVIENLNIKPNGIYVDGTLGGAGHSSEIVKRLSQDGLLVGIDRDQDALYASHEKLKDFENVKYIWGKHEDIKSILNGLGIKSVDGILLDLGVSSYQLDEESRGFSYMKDSKLDMRMDKTQTLTAEKIINDYTKEQLVDIFFKYGEEKNSKKIADRIIKNRQENRIETTRQLREIIKGIDAKNEIDSCKRIFQALRIEVNGELKDLENAINDCIDLLNNGGRLCIITVHSLEDRIVKLAFNNAQGKCTCPKDFPVCVCGAHSLR
jgi:16S rRNA (cytosine1402-N4)-methyltransferase